MDILQKQAMWILIVTYLSDCSGWTCIHGNCYLVVSSTLKNWQDALNDCKNNGGELLSITTNTEQQTVQGILGGNLSRTYWIGLSLKAGKWSWSDSCTLTYTNWDKGQPQGKGENCAGIFQATGGKWHDLSCSSKYGYICKSEIDECASNPCIYGTCIDSINSYQCLCNPGYTGLNCVYEIDECSTAPCNNGTCIDLVNGFLCQCPPGYEGTLCDQEIDECKNKPCVYGNCTDKINGYQCHCKPGYTGTSCEYEIDECNSSPCVNGTCYDLVNKFMCLCSPGFQGKFCEKKIDMCQSTKCVHGSCVSHINRFECRCFWGAFGINCQFSIMDYTVPIALALGFGILILFILVLYLSTKLRKYRDMFDNFIMEKVMRNYNKPPTDQMKRTFQIKRLQNV